MEKATILLIDFMVKNDLKDYLDQQTGISVVGITDNVDIAFTMAERYEPTIIILNLDLTVDEVGLDIAEAFALEFTSSSLILMSSLDNKKILRHALKVGAKDVITLPIENKKILKIIQQVAKYDLKRRELFSIKKKVQPQFKVITVFNTKGGVGKSTVSLNLAIAIQQLTKDRVLLADLDLFSGNLSLMAGVDARRTIKDMIDELNNLDKEFLDEFCINHYSGIKILTAPAHPEYASFIEAEHIEKILNLVSQVFNYVVIDAPTHFSDTVIPALEFAQEIIIVANPDLASIQNLKQCLDLLNSLSMQSKVKVVFNKVGNNGYLDVKDLEKQLGVDVQCNIPNCEKEALNAVNLGVPLILEYKKIPASQKIREFAAKLVGDNKSKSFVELRR
ncbi:hypothetical protein SYNTR_1698 [Candidatus Syntrophocurvum alkaliphilum]|uniref:Stage 0 sporulation protein A homolog n=1 Tax=Candidatus Syntrophocurvum alkaliphilum TaxID=2293317 RepID=A0A6I6DDU5_9FIRM|nr:AAA family ATPase [Candidatus Syntrophocurvum alkaliphilum]QGU00292.1 hypothetical protein SYNTR_1698 [Candidatus Syntrophocurvum alkaliphilum]